VSGDPRVYEPSANVTQTSMQGLFKLPALVFGAASFSNQYNSEALLASDVPFRTVRLALRYAPSRSLYRLYPHTLHRYGITAFDTSAFYGVSEIVLGTVLKALEPEFPRESYKLVSCRARTRMIRQLTSYKMTKCGRYGQTKVDFDYSPTAVRASVQRSLRRLNTSYLDAVRATNSLVNYASDALFL
jgi:D-arabinose 1-dehydrogenase